MKILTFSTLYPHAARPGHGIFVETRLRQLIATDRAATRRYAEQFGWAATTKGQLELFRRVLSSSSAVPEMRAASAG